MIVKSKNNRLKHVIYDLSRINEWWLLSLGFVLFAFIPNYYVNNGHTINIGSLIELFISAPLYISIIIIFSAQIFLFASNDYFDRNVDALDPYKRKRNPVCNGTVTLPGVRTLLIISGSIPLFASFYFGLFPFIFTAFTLFVFYFYTAPPLRFKNKVILDVLSHGIFVNTFPYFFCLVVLNDFSFGTIYLLSAIMMRSTMAQLFQEIRDYNVDKQVEKNTVVMLGQRRGLWLVFSIYIALFLISASLLTSYQIWGWGIDLYYIIILILWFTYLPIFYRLFKTKNLGKSIERLWMGQGRTNRWQILQYISAFGLYALIIISLFSINYF